MGYCRSRTFQRYHIIIQYQYFNIKNNIKFLINQAITTAYYRGAVGCILLYDISNKKSFESLEKWLSEARENSDESTIIMVVGNKTDLEDIRQVDKQVV